MRLRSAGLPLIFLLGLLAAPITVEAQSQRIFRVGYLGGSPPSPAQPTVMGFVRGLRELGYVEGKNLAIEYRWVDGNNEGFPALAAELVRLKVDVIVAHSVPAVLAAKQTTVTIPIVLLNVPDPVGSGLVTSLAHPGGNVTGVSSQSADFIAKLLELSKDVVPQLARVAVITPPERGANRKALETAAPALGIALHAFPLRDSTDVVQAYTMIAEQGDQAIVVLPDHVTWFHRAQILDLAGRRRLPTICIYEVWAQAGCLLAYGPNLPDMWYRAGVFAGKLLKGAKPADLPIEQPTKFELVINLKTAKALGLTIPPALLGRADEVIQ